MSRKRIRNAHEESNKIANWYVYMASVDETFRQTLRYRVAERLVEQFWIDIVLGYRDDRRFRLGRVVDVHDIRNERVALGPHE
jgi:hypothetical protein